MGKRWIERQFRLTVWWMRAITQLVFILGSVQTLHGQARKELNIQDDVKGQGVQVIQRDQLVMMTNGIVSITLSTPGGMVTNISYKGSDNLLETQNLEDNRGYWDVVWNRPGTPTPMDKLSGTSYKVISQKEDQTEISFTSTWTPSNATVPLNVDKRFVMLRNSSGFYTYTVLEKLKGWPAFYIQEGRFLLKLQENKFHYMAMSDVRQRIMPMPEDRGTGLVLDYPEAVQLTNPTNVQLKGEVDDKYLYSCDNKDNKVHGWVSPDLGAGMWMITPSNEFKNGGPLKQDLTSHVGPTMLNMFTSTHYAGEIQALKFEAEEYWKKVLGPFFVYFNSDAAAKKDPSILWEDARKQSLKEVGSWPYNFPLSNDFIKSDRRGAVRGQLLVHDRYKNKDVVPAASAWVGLTTPGEPGSWQIESKGYHFWAQADRNGNFLIKNVLPGKYGLFAWVPGTIGDYRYATEITITPGSDIKLDNLVFEPPRRGPTLWEIGIPDRTAAEFFIPDIPAQYKRHLYKNNTEKFREYGLWTRYKDLYPNADLTFTIGVSDYKRDWFYAHVTRKVGTQQYQATTWRILFDLTNVNSGANYTLQLALASANGAELQVRFNDPKLPPDFTTHMIGADNAVARHSIHGLYHLYSVSIAGSRLIRGRNTIFLTQTSNLGPFRELMYDYIRFEGPAGAP